MKSIEALKKRLSTDNTLLIQNEEGYLVNARFEWKKPATEVEISNFEKANDIILPNDYREFLKISNGAILFKDTWGILLYGLDELIKKTKHYKSVFGDMLKETWLFFGEYQSDGDVFIFDLEKVKNNEKSYLLFGYECDHPDDYRYLGSFETWLDRVIVAQGAKYWLWFPNR